MARILVVDDEPFNRELLVAYLEDLGHELVLVDSGENALALADRRPPDLVLLDVMMRGMDGYETARGLKKLRVGEFLPIILVTALNDRDARVKGLDAGADEFLTKPVDRNELLLRLNNLLTLRAHTISLAQRNRELLELQTFRDEMSALLVHDLKNPMTVVQLNLEFILEQLPDLGEEHLIAIGDSRNACKRVMRLIANLLDLVRLEAGRLDVRPAPFDLAPLLAELVAASKHMLQQRKITVTLPDIAAVRVMADSDLISRVLENLIDNAVRYTPSGGRIEIVADITAGTTTLRLGNTGPAIPVEQREEIFEKFGQASPGAGRMNLGLGLYFCRLVVEAHRGKLYVAETSELPTVFHLVLPSA